MSTAAHRLLLLSYSNIMGRLASGELTFERLADALFFLGCTRTHVLGEDAPTADNEIFTWPSIRDKFKSDDERIAFFARFQEEVRRAEAQGRAGWFRPTADADVDAREAFGSLLRAAGITLPDLSEHDPRDFKNKPALTDICAELSLPLVPVWSKTGPIPR